jgi:hypothetical protein
MTVPCCQPCNVGFSADEEYVRNIFTAEHRAAGHPVAAKLLQGQVMRSYVRNRRMLFEVGSRMRLGEARTAEGIIIPNLPLMQVKTGPIVRVMQKITRGLFYAGTGRALPLNWAVGVSAKLGQRELAIALDVIDKPYMARTEKWVFLGEDKVFAFRGAMADRTLNHSVWALVFYNAIAHCTWTFEPGRR